ncbi:hypothetical protein Tco_1092479 [Tanacetum coccineum]|uniref:Uncharacterized protein n=1 Tax=Tanacetum coccineum TaxID=301880 RepID=A0ABQ5I9Z6_9ASTR
MGKETESVLSEDTVESEGHLCHPSVLVAPLHSFPKSTTTHSCFYFLFALGDTKVSQFVGVYTAIRHGPLLPAWDCGGSYVCVVVRSPLIVSEVAGGLKGPTTEDEDTPMQGDPIVLLPGVPPKAHPVQTQPPSPSRTSLFQLPILPSPSQYCNDKVLAVLFRVSLRDAVFRTCVNCGSDWFLSDRADIPPSL